MDKQEVTQKYAELTNKLGRKATRREFTKLVGISRRFIDKLFGNFNNLKNGEMTKEIVEDKSVMMQGKNLESVLDACGVDREKWEVNDFTVKELSGGDFLFTVYFKKKRFIPDFSKIIQNIVESSPVTNKIDYVEGEMLAIVNLADVHVGKLCSHREVGHNYDIKIASKIFREAIDYKIAQLQKYKIEKIVFVVGNDFLQVDNQQNTTTAGTRQDVDGRFYKMLEEGSKLLIEAITKLSLVAKTHCLVTVGNHSTATEFGLGLILDAYFHNNPNVTVDNEPTPRKYYRFHKSLIGFLHGDEVKLNQLPLLMATEAKKDWGETTYKHIFTGHFHHQKMILDEMTGCIVEILPSLSGTDFWHKKKGFCNNIRSAQTAIFDKEKGLVTKIYFNL